MLSDRELLAAVQEAADDYTVYGELGRQGDSLAALLARERVGERLVVLMVSASTSSTGDVDLSIEVTHQLNAHVPDGGTKCPACGVQLRPWVRFCTHCGHDVTGQGAVTAAERAELRDAVVDAVEGDYEYLGEIRRSEGGGDVFFARERSSGRIAALRLNRSRSDGEFELGETNILRKVPSDKPVKPALVSVTQLLRKLEPDAEPPLPSAGGAGALAGAVRSEPARVASILHAARLRWPRQYLVVAGAIVVAMIVILTILVLR